MSETAGLEEQEELECVSPACWSVALQLDGSCVPSHVVPWTCWRTSESREISTGRL